ncbi:MAG TPA: hypothetical protein VFX21_14555 [Acidimicrobiia bacterium]|nr:hypothetical protein [Acidimicrobiia bacterium]
MLYALATLNDGTKIVTEFEKLKGIRQLAADVFSGKKGFPVWRKVSDVHPISGEPGVLTRRREFISGSVITRLEVVKPKPGFESEDLHQMMPEFFEPDAIMSNLDRNGLWTAPTAQEDLVAGATPGAQYPLHRDPDQRRYVILTWNEDPAAQVRHYLDAERVAGATVDLGAGFSDDDDDEAWGDDVD